MAASSSPSISDMPLVDAHHRRLLTAIEDKWAVDAAEAAEPGPSSESVRRLALEAGIRDLYDRYVRGTPHELGRRRDSASPPQPQDELRACM